MATVIDTQNPVADGAQLLEIAALIDDICERRASLNPFADIDEPELRCRLFELLDAPTQEAWEKNRDFQVFPHFFTGLSEPSPLGFSIGDLVYDFGLSDRVCPPREQLMQALRWALSEQLVD